jgi:hypothetical protein
MAGPNLFPVCSQRSDLVPVQSWWVSASLVPVHKAGIFLPHVSTKLTRKSLSPGYSIREMRGISFKGTVSHCRKDRQE